MNDHRTRVANADRTHTLLNALKMLTNTDFAMMMGSGIMVHLTPITENKHLADEFMLAAEDMTEIAPLLADSIRQTLDRRKASLRSEASEIERAIAK